MKTIAKYPPMVSLLFLVVVFSALAVLAIPAFFGTDHHPLGFVYSSNLRSIASAYQAYTTSEKTPRIYTAKPGDTVHDIAVLLAQNDGLYDAAFWIFKPDLNGQPMPKNVLIGDPSYGKINPDFAKLTLAWEFAANIPANAPPTTTPVAWTRGLQPDGTWDETSPWKGAGGHIAFLDGHVEWVDKKLTTEDAETRLVNFTTHQPTVNIREALPPGAVILSAEPHPFLKAKP